MGGIPVEEMATKRKQIQNLELSGTNQTNSFAILNDIDDRTLLQTAQDLDTQLGSDDEKDLEQP
jgi:hypothetical protein